MALDNKNGGRRPHEREISIEPLSDTQKEAKLYDSVPAEENGKPHRAWQEDKEGRPDILHVNSAQEGSQEVERERENRSSKKKKKIRRILLIAVVEMLTLVLIFCTGFVLRYMNMTQDVAFDVQKVKNTNLDVSKQQQMEGYWTVAVFGVDSRDGGLGKGALADVQIIVNVDMGSGDIRMLSVYRDSYLNVGKRYAKINEAYSTGGPEGAVAALNKNLDLDIQNYATFNWKAVIDVIDMLGGVEADVTKKEFREMNAYITETSLESGFSKNPAAHYLKEPGQQHLNGVQAVAYARLRHADTDFKRTERQRDIIAQLLEKAKRADLATLTSIVNVVLPQISFNMDAGDILQLAKGISRYNIVGSAGFPADLKTQMMGSKGDCVIPTTLASNVTKLHEFLFNDADYNPSSAVWTYSQKIAEDSGNYKSSAEAAEAERKAKADKESRAVESSKKAEEEGEKESKETKPLETDRFGNIIEPETTRKRGKMSYETDEDGNLLDEDGNILETDRHGNPIDADGETLETSTKRETRVHPGETEPESELRPGERESGRESGSIRESTKEAEITAADPGSAPGESPRSAKSSKESEEKRVPGGKSTEKESTRAPEKTTVAQKPGDSIEKRETPKAPSAPVTERMQERPGGGQAEVDNDYSGGPGDIVE